MFSFKNLACGWRLGTGVAALVALVLLALPAPAAAQEEKGVNPATLHAYIKGQISTNGALGTIPSDGTYHGQWSVRYQYWDGMGGSLGTTSGLLGDHGTNTMT